MFKAFSIAKALGVVQLVKEVKGLFISTEKVQNVRYKGSDTTKFTDYHKAVIKAEHAAYLIHNQTNDKKMTAQQLADLLNAKLHLHKSVRSYSRIWNSEEK